jgi:hypothetical protein
VIAAEPSLSSEMVTDAFDATMVSNRAVSVMADALTDDPDVLHVGAPPAVGRLVAELVERGSTAATVCGPFDALEQIGHPGLRTSSSSRSVRSPWAISSRCR